MGEVICVVGGCYYIRRQAYDGRKEAGMKKRDGLQAFMQLLQVEGTFVPMQTLRQQRGVLKSSPILMLCRAHMDPQSQEPSYTRLPALSDTMGNPGPRLLMLLSHLPEIWA